MNGAEYTAIAAQLGALAAVVADMPLADFLATISRAESLGPIMDPTAFRDGMQNLEDARQLAEGAMKFQRAAKEVRAAALNRLAVRAARSARDAEGKP